MSTPRNYGLVAVALLALTGCTASGTKAEHASVADTNLTVSLRIAEDPSFTGEPIPADRVWDDVFDHVLEDQQSRALLAKMNGGRMPEVAFLASSRPASLDELGAPPSNGNAVAVRARYSGSFAGPGYDFGHDLKARLDLGSCIAKSEDVGFTTAVASMTDRATPTTDELFDAIDRARLPRDAFLLACEDYLVRNARGWRVMKVGSCRRFEDERRDLDGRIEKLVRASSPGEGKPQAN